MIALMFVLSVVILEHVLHSCIDSLIFISDGTLVMHASTHVCVLGCHFRARASFLHSL